jgi:hypothetical protein
VRSGRKAEKWTRETVSTPGIARIVATSSSVTLLKTRSAACPLKTMSEAPLASM